MLMKPFTRYLKTRSNLTITNYWHKFLPIETICGSPFWTDPNDKETYLILTDNLWDEWFEEEQRDGMFVAMLPLADIERFETSFVIDEPNISQG